LASKAGSQAMKFWLIAFFLTPDGEFISKREIAYKDKATCYTAMDLVRAPKNLKNEIIVQVVCVSDDHFMGRKKDSGVEYD
jgi:hypothetical protein